MLSGTSVKVIAPILALSTFCISGLSAQKPKPTPDKDGVYAGWPGIPPASLLHPVPAVLPDDSQLKAAKHVCAFLVVVNADGSVRKLALANRTPSPLDDIALEAVRQSQFAPGTFEGKPVPTQAMVYVPFLGDGQPATPLEPTIRGKKPQLLKSLKYPVPVYTPEAQFSDQARREHYQGMVLLRALIDEDGLPRLVGLLAGAGKGLDENALAAVRSYKFKPATLEGIPVPFLMNIQVNFRM
jgi:TonB family protein